MKVLIADDHEVVRRGLRELLEDEFGSVSFGEAGSGADALELMTAGKWDIVLLDICMPETDVIEILENILEIDAEVPVLILTAASESEYAIRTIRSGAKGFITKQQAADDLITAVRKILNGEMYLTNGAAKALASGLRQEPAALHTCLSKRELQVFCLIARGKRVKEIAYELGVSDKTIATYVARIREKTGMSSNVEIARYALQKNLVD